MVTRRSAFKAAAGLASVSALWAGPAGAADRVLKVGISLPFTGSDSAGAARIGNGGILALDEANASHSVKGYTFVVEKFDDGTPNAGQYDPLQAANNARRMIADRGIVAALGPEMSGAGKAMAPILSQGNLAIITPSSTNADITDPKFAPLYRPAGKAIYFRTVATDAYQGPNAANYLARALKVKRVFLLDDFRSLRCRPGRRVQGAG